MSTPDIDPRLDRRWRELSSELPSPATDDSIRAAARRVRHRPLWQRYAPLAAAASVGVIAFLVARQSPSPAPIAAPVAAPVATPVAAPVAAPIAAPAAEAVAPAMTPAAAPVAQPAQQTEAPPAGRARIDAARTTPAAVVAPAPNAAPLAARKSAVAVERERPAARAEASLRDGAASEGVEALPPKLGDLVKADAARRRGVDPASVTIGSVEAVTWSDGALGCRTSGEMAIQVLTPGYRVIVVAGGEELEYHTDQRERIRFCPRIGATR
ncbi:MAG: hypothetical protein CMLOHMNK_02220 [Steroidobacteraceae bacterium]|nr:hypothetical protein [Steroidobacteraceae bacterium]